MFNIPQLIFVFATLFFAFFYFYSKSFSVLINTFIKVTYHSFSRMIIEVFNSSYILIIPIASSIYYAIHLPISYDEAITYLNFSSKGIPTSMTYYPIPGNHILHSIITNITIYISFLNPLLCLRISPICANILTWIFAYSFLKKYFNKTTAEIVVSIASMLFFSVYYSYMSRGYGLVNLFFVTALYSSYNIIKENNQTRHWVYFGISSILGFYTMTSFLYPFVMLNVFILLFNRKCFAKQTYVTIIVSISVLLLYIPVIKYNGISALIMNKTVEPIPRNEVLQRLPTFLLDSISDITGFSWIYTISCLALSLIMLLIKKNKENILIYLLFIISPIVLLILHSVIPFSRTFNYYGFLIVFLIVLPWSDLLQRIKIRYLIVFLFSIQALLFCNFYPRVYLFEEFFLTSDYVIKEIAGNKRYLISVPLFDTLLEYELKTKGYKKHIAAYNQLKINADTVRNYDIIVIGKTNIFDARNNDFTVKMTPKYRTKFLNVYYK